MIRRTNQLWVHIIIVGNSLQKFYDQIRVVQLDILMVVLSIAGPLLGIGRNRNFVEIWPKFRRNFCRNFVRNFDSTKFVKSRNLVEIEILSKFRSKFCRNFDRNFDSKTQNFDEISSKFSFQFFTKFY